MKVVVLFGLKSLREKDSEKFASLMDELVEKLPINTDVEWYVLEESKVEEGIKKIFNEDSK